MKGRNQLLLNTATMIEIVQYWIDNKAMKVTEDGPFVTSFRDGTGPNQDGYFVVEFGNEKPPTLDSIIAEAKRK